MCQERVGANLVFALERITLSFLCTMGEHKVRPYIGLSNMKMGAFFLSPFLEWPYEKFMLFILKKSVNIFFA